MALVPRHGLRLAKNAIDVEPSLRDQGAGESFGDADLEPYGCLSVHGRKAKRHHEYGGRRDDGMADGIPDRCCCFSHMRASPLPVNPGDGWTDSQTSAQ